MDLLRFWKSASLSRTRVPGRKRQPLKRESLRIRSALFLSNGCATGSRQQAWNLKKANHALAQSWEAEIKSSSRWWSSSADADGGSRARGRTRTNASGEYRRDFGRGQRRRCRRRSGQRGREVPAVRRA